MLIIYPDQKEVALKRSAPPSSPNHSVPGPQDQRLIPPRRDLTIEVPWLPGNLFHYWLPESIAGTPVYEHESWKGVGPSGTLGYQYRDGDKSFQVRASPGDDELSVVIELANLSKERWGDRFVNCCLGLWDAPSFGEDKAMKRTWVIRDGVLELLCQINPWAGAKSLKTFYPMPGCESHPYWHQQTVIRKTCPKPVDEGIIMTTSADGHSTVAVTFAPPVLCVFNNTDSAFQCIHALSLIRDLEPGDRLIMMGKVYFDRGGPEACWRRYKSDLRDWESCA